MIERKHEQQQSEPASQEASHALKEQIIHELDNLSPFYLEKTLAYIQSFPRLPAAFPARS